jgi:hypothetical protein
VTGQKKRERERERRRRQATIQMPAGDGDLCCAGACRWRTSCAEAVQGGAGVRGPGVAIVVGNKSINITPDKSLSCSLAPDKATHACWLPCIGVVFALLVEKTLAGRRRGTDSTCHRARVTAGSCHRCGVLGALWDNCSAKFGSTEGWRFVLALVGGVNAADLRFAFNIQISQRGVSPARPKQNPQQPTSCVSTDGWWGQYPGLASARGPNHVGDCASPSSSGNNNAWSSG